MSRFDEWAKSSAQGGSTLRAWRRSRPARGVATDGAGLDRRELLRKAGIVGGATIVGSSLIQSVTAPAFAVSAICSDPRGCGSTSGCAPCAAGTACATGVDCVSTVCNNRGVCTVVDGGTCGPGSPGQKNASCASGKCDGATDRCLVSSGATCSTDQQCASGKCQTTTSTCK